MINDIRMHLHHDEEYQAKLESESHEDLMQRLKANQMAFMTNMPKVGAQLRQIPTSNISIFCNLHGQYNIIDFGTGRTFYGLNPKAEVQQHLSHWCANCTYVDTDKALSESDESLLSFQERLVRQSKAKHLPKKVTNMVIFGLAAGFHVLDLLENYDISHLVIYEPELQYLKASAMLADWQTVFSVAKQKNTLIFMMMSNDGSTLIDDFKELQAHSGCSDFYYYKHYHHPSFDIIEQNLQNIDFKVLAEAGFNMEFKHIGRSYKPYWTSFVNPSCAFVTNKSPSPLFKENMSAFAKYFPEIHNEFEQYVPDYWFPVADDSGEINLLDVTDGAVFHHQARQEGMLSKENFERYPNKDGLVLGYKGKKLKNYIHYQYVKETETLLDKIHEKKGSLPEKLQSLILFGIGTGYQLEALMLDHEVEMLFICEPNKDFFYASLFAIDWSAILNKIDSKEGRLYINIGDDGQNIYKDLLHQFYSIGPYILTNTYFYQSYYNPNLIQAVASLREQLQLVISFGEYYDHARYGIAHTKEMLSRGTRCLVERNKRSFPPEMPQVPVFIVGNGPSLDTSIEAIKAWQQQVIIISCGTALMPLYKAGIVPDFHAEIEQNRSTFDWCCRVGDFEYLKKITLLSCNGIHPDTCRLFKDTLIAFKEGESSTVSALEIDNSVKFHELQFAFPTVSNLAINIACELGFKQVYLLGVDLGFVSNVHHHSKQSGYYKKQGKELYDYRENANTSIKVEGNFRPFVFTKYEFKVSKNIIEKMLAANKQVHCFNVSDGAKIQGASALLPENILISSTKEQKQINKDYLVNNIFLPFDNFESYADKFDEKFKPNNIEEELQELGQLIDNTEPTVDCIHNLIKAQRTFLFDSYSSGKSLLFYVLYGSFNFTNAFLSKVTNAEDCDLYLSESLNIWRDWFDKIKRDYLSDPARMDCISSFSHLRQQQFLGSLKQTHDVKVVGAEIEKDFLDSYLKFTEVSEQKYDLIECVVLNSHKDCPKIGNADRLILEQKGGQLSDLLSRGETAEYANNISYYWYPWADIRALDDEDVKNGISPVYMKQQTASYLSYFRKNFDYSALYIPKLIFIEDTFAIENVEYELSLITKQLINYDYYIEYDYYFVIPLHADKKAFPALDARYTRGIARNQTLKQSDFVFTMRQKIFDDILNEYYS